MYKHDKEHGKYEMDGARKVMAVRGFASATTSPFGQRRQTTNNAISWLVPANASVDFLVVAPLVQRQRPAPTLVCGMYTLSIQRTKEEANPRVAAFALRTYTTANDATSTRHDIQDKIVASLTLTSLSVLMMENVRFPLASMSATPKLKYGLMPSA